MKTALKILKWFGIVLGSLLFLVIVVAAVLWFDPGLVITDARVNQMVQKSAGELFKGKAPHVTLRLDRHHWNGKHIFLDVEPFCLKDPDACFKKVHFETAFRIISIIKIEIDELGPIFVTNDYLHIVNEPAKKKPEEPKKKSTGSPLDKIKLSPTMKLNPIAILFPDVKYIDQGKTTTANLRLDTEGHNLELDANAQQGKALKARIELTTKMGTGGDTPFHLLATADLPEKAVVKANIDGDVRWHEMFFNLAGKISASHMIPWVSLIELNNLKVRRDQQLTVASDILMKVEPKFQFQAPDSALPKADFETNVHGKFDIEQQKSNYLYKVRLGPMTDNGIKIHTFFSGLYPFPKNEAYRFGLDKIFVDVEIPEFQNLVNALKRTSSAVPAPLNALKGPVKFQVGNETKAIEEDNFPIKFITKLTSKEQDIVTDSEGMLRFIEGRKKVRLEGSTKIENLTVTLPGINPIEAEPKLINDPRMHFARKGWKPKPAQPKPTATPENEAASGFEMSWKVNTVGNGIKIYYPMFKPFVPVQASWTIQDQGTNGTLNVQPFDITYMNRTAHVEKLRYFKDVTANEFRYDGRLSIAKTEYTIFIDIIDEAGKPKIVLTSDPPLPESDIVSVLLFNQTAAQLSPDESTSVGQTQSAVANRALGLFSIWALSSTPVEAVSYDAASHVYSARVKLANGLTATVGTNWDNTQQVALRKRLGRNFVLSTIVENNQQTNSETKKTLLQWFRRF